MNLQKAGRNMKMARKAIVSHMQKYGSNGKIGVYLPINPRPDPGTGIFNFQWDRHKCGSGIILTENNMKCWLKEQQYLFRTMLGNSPMHSGVYYWQIWADPRTENELKIGVVTKADFNLNTSFSDFEFGYAFYGLG